MSLHRTWPDSVHFLKRAATFILPCGSRSSSSDRPFSYPCSCACTCAGHRRYKSKSCPPAHPPTRPNHSNTTRHSPLILQGKRRRRGAVRKSTEGKVRNWNALFASACHAAMAGIVRIGAGPPTASRSSARQPVGSSRAKEISLSPLSRKPRLPSSSTSPVDARAL